MATELITFKMETVFLEEVDQTSKSAGFQNRTEFIRTALREKVEEIKLKKAMVELSKFRGKAPRKTTDKERAKIREFVFKQQIGSIENTGDSVKEIRDIRRKLSKKKIDLDEINKLRGKAPRKTTDKERAKIREFAFEEIERLSK